jgi:hypothetical protein
MGLVPKKEVPIEQKEMKEMEETEEPASEPANPDSKSE